MSINEKSLAIKQIVQLVMDTLPVMVTLIKEIVIAIREIKTV